MTSTPLIQGNVLTYQQCGQPAHVLVDTSEWYAWLRSASTFRFHSEQGTFTAHKERAGSRRGGEYWKAYRKRHGKLSRVYLGKSEELTLEQLKSVAVVLASKAEGENSLDVPDLGGGTRASSEASSRVSAPLRGATGEPSPHEAGLSKPGLSSLPLPLTTLIGRQQEVRAICALLSRPEVRLLTISGTGGVGKTRLALQVASELLDDFAEGICFVSLAPISDPNVVLPAIAEALGVNEVAGRSFLDLLKTSLREKHLLLVLDNFEHLLAAAPHLTALLASCPSLNILVTSRATLHVQGEQEFPVPPLALPDLKELPPPDGLSQYAAVALFLQRAQAVKPDLQLTPATASAIAEICVRLDGLPLAIELAAARSKLFPPPALLARLGQRLAVLTSGAQDAPARQRTLRDTLAWSYHLLDAAEQQVFRRLAVFAGSCTLEALETMSVVLGDEAVQVVESVGSLLDKNLLQQREQEAHEPRLLMLETIREYGLERLAASGDMEVTRRAHANYYLRLAEEVEPKLYGSEQQVWFDRLEQEHENLRAALQWLLERKEAERALRLCGALCWFWEVHRHVSEGEQFLERALAGSEAVAPSVRAAALTGAGWLAYFQNDHQRADALLRESLALFQALGDKRGVAMSRRRLGMLAWNEGKYAIASALGEQALTIFKEVDDKRGIAYALLLLAYVATSEGEYRRASTLLQECLSIFRQLDDKRKIAVVLHRLAGALFAQGDALKASFLVEESLALARKVGDKETLPNALALSGRIALHQGDAPKARILLEEYVAFSRESGNPWSMADSLSSLAGVITLQGEYVAAHTLYEESLAIARRMDDKLKVSAALQGLADVAAAQGEPAWAARLWGAAEALRQTIGAPIPPVDRPSYERSVTGARTQLGEKPFATAWAQGRTMTLEQVLTAQGPVTMPASILTEPSTTPPVPKALTSPDGLTAREIEVLRLVAQGLTDPQVADQLVISPHTVNSHLKAIYGKLGVTSRSAATRYAMEHHLM